MRRHFIIIICFLWGISSYAQFSGASAPPTNLKKTAIKPFTEIGLHVGKFYIDGDIPASFRKGFGFGIHVRKAITYSFSVRSELFYGKAYGLSLYPWTHESEGGGLVSSTFDVYKNNEDGWFPNYETSYLMLDVEALFNIGNILYKKQKPRWNLYVGAGLGVSNFSTNLDLLDKNNKPYLNLRKEAHWSEKNYNNIEGRSKIKNNLEQIYDGTYETPGPKENGRFRLGNETNIDFIASLMIGFSVKINRRLNIGLEQKLIWNWNDFLDGINRRTASDLTTRYDIPLYSSIRVNYNIGKGRRLEPKYWRNPMMSIVTMIDSISNNKNQISYEDSDKDGVPDFWDQEPHSTYGCAVDVKGITLDSDKDGIIDCKDQYPFDSNNNNTSISNLDSRERYLNDLLAAIEKSGSNFYTKEDIENRIETYLNEKLGSSLQQNYYHLYPIILFEKDQYNLTFNAIVDIHRLSLLMKEDLTICLSIEGHADSENTRVYNQLLSERRALAVKDYLLKQNIEISRLKIIAYGEGRPISNSNNYNAINRRVEFVKCTCSE